MPPIPLPWARALDAALVSLAAYQALDHLVRRHPAPTTVAEAVAATGLSVGDTAHALSALASRGILADAEDGLTLAGAYAGTLPAAWAHLDQCPELRHHARQLAAERGGTAQVVLHVTFAPVLVPVDAPAVPSVPPASPSFSGTVPGGFAPARPADPAKPAA